MYNPTEAIYSNLYTLNGVGLRTVNASWKEKKVLMKENVSHFIQSTRINVSVQKVTSNEAEHS